MPLTRRDFLAASALTAGAGAVIAGTPQQVHAMYGLIGKITAVAGRRDDLIAILLEGVTGMPGCLSYVVAQDPADEHAIWITEVWDSAEHHKASLSLPAVRDAIARGRPLIAGFDSHTVTKPVGGHGLPTP